MNKYNNTLAYTWGISVFAIVFSWVMQKSFESDLVKCRYVDPWMIDILAFAAGIYLILDGFAEIKQHKHAVWKNHIGRMVRIGIGFAVITLHLLYVVHG